MLATAPNDVDTMKGLYHDAMTIWLADLPVIPLTQAPAPVTVPVVGPGQSRGHAAGLLSIAASMLVPPVPPRLPASSSGKLVLGVP